MTSGDSIRRARQRAGLGQAQLARLLGVTRQTVSSWETGAASPRGSLGKLYEVLEDLGDEEERGPRDVTSLSDAELAVRLFAVSSELDVLAREFVRRSGRGQVERAHAHDLPGVAYPTGPRPEGRGEARS